jgi:hypothetical protein
MRAEFSEKDEEYREDLIQQLVVGLRDGPLPERTFENDPSLTKAGPTATGWIKVANSNETCHFSQDSHSLLITTSEQRWNTHLFAAPSTDPSNRKELAEFEGTGHVQQHVITPEGMTVLVTEFLPKDSNTISSSDAHRLWLVDAKGKREVIAPPGVTNWFAAKSCVSPDARFVALGSWETQSDKQRARVIYLLDVRTGQWKKVSEQGTLLEVVDWSREKPSALVLTGLGVNKDEIRKAFTLALTTGQLTPLTEIPAEFKSGRKSSPDGKRHIEVIGKEKLVITDSTSGEHREFVFHSYDRRNVYPDSVTWGNNRYLVFRTTQTSLIDTSTLKMNYPATKESGINSVEFSPDFKLALGWKTDGHYLGKVEMSRETGQ